MTPPWHASATGGVEGGWRAFFGGCGARDIENALPAKKRRPRMENAALEMRHRRKYADAKNAEPANGIGSTREAPIYSPPPIRKSPDASGEVWLLREAPLAGEGAGEFPRRPTSLT